MQTKEIIQIHNSLSILKLINIKQKRDNERLIEENKILKQRLKIKIKRKIV